MTDAVLSGLVTDVLRKLTCLAIQELGALWRLEDDVSSLKNDFHEIQGALDDAEEKHMEGKAAELSLKSIIFVAVKMENLIDEVSTEYMIRTLHKELGIMYRVRAFFSSHHNNLMFGLRIAHDLKAIRRKCNSIASKISEIKSIPGANISVNAGVGGEIPNRETSSHIHSSLIYGRDEEVEMVTKKICSKDIGKHVADEIPVYVLWGMTGVGKTTLAQLVYNHERVNKHFQFKCWMYVSEKFQVKELIRGIIESIDKHECGLSQLDGMQKSLQDKLKEKRFLIVLDDVWIEDAENVKWKQLSTALSCGRDGSIVLITTRSKPSGRITVDPELQHEVGCLSKENSWSLFKQLAFAERRDGANIKELEPIGKKIVDKCKGLPLAVKTFGVLMWSKSSADDWQRILGSDTWDLRDLEKKILHSLKFSYDNLLPHLKRCFTYCCLFPKGYNMKKDVLILLWMSNGLIPRSRGADRWYMLGEEICKHLVWGSFFQVVRTPSGEEIYKMHDLMHEMAQYVMRPYCLVIEPGKELVVPDEVLHLSLSRLDCTSVSHNIRNLRSLRSMFIVTEEYIGSISHISNHVYLRVLYLGGIWLKSLPESICKLKLLKHLNLSGSSIETLPESIIYLQNLQVLLLESCYMLRKLPDGMRYMRNLLYLNTDDCFLLQYLPIGIKELTRLRFRTSRFPVGKKNGAQIGELGDLNLLGRKLNLVQLENVGGFKDANGANLKSKSNLLVLGLYWSEVLVREDKSQTFAHDEEVLKGLEPNPSLKELIIQSYMGKIMSSSWMVNLKNLVEIRFLKCTKCEHIPPLGKLPRLEIIRLEYMDSLKCFHHDDDTLSWENILFPGLLQLSISKCPSLESLPSSLQNLTKLRIESCDSLSSLPDEKQSFRKLENLEITNCPNLVSLPSNLPNLTILSITSCKSLSSLPDEPQSFKDLKDLVITGCPNLVSLPSNIPNLTMLYITSCESLRYLPNETQTFENLKDLMIIDCPKLVSFPSNLLNLTVLYIRSCQSLHSLQAQTYQSFKNLRNLTVIDCPNLVSLPYKIQTFENLKEIMIIDCPKLVSWPSNLPDLTMLYIRSCQSLHSLQGQNDKSFKNLRNLTVYDCPNLVSLPKKLPNLTKLDLDTMSWKKLRSLPDK